MEINLLPPRILSKLRVPDEMQREVGLFVSVLLVIGFVPVMKYVPHVCLAEMLLGIPCPGCGMLHAGNALIHGAFAAAWKANPAGYGLAGLLVCQIAILPLTAICAKAKHKVKAVSHAVASVAWTWVFVVWILRLISGGPYGSGFLPQM